MTKETDRSVPLAGIVQGQEEIDAVNRVLQTGWHVSGKECIALQNELADFHNVKHCVVVNSGSSANLLALCALNLKEQDRVLTSACGFPATLNPILHLRLSPVLVDYNLQTFNVDLDQIENTLKFYNNNGINVKAMILAHTLGSSLDMDRLLDMTIRYKIKLIEDCCEAMGAKYSGQMVGSFGDVSTISFYSSHQISGFGGGGAVLTNDTDIYEKVKSLRDWGKQSVREGLICTKMDAEVDGKPYDQQYTYNTIGYNMRFPDGNCAYAREQLKRLPEFTMIRQRNYQYLDSELRNLPLYRMTWPEKASPAFFGYPLVLKEVGRRNDLVNYMEDHNVHVRLFFAGNILKHLPYKNVQFESIYNKFTVADYLMDNALFCGCWPGLTLEDMEYSANVIKAFFNK